MPRLFVGRVGVPQAETIPAAGPTFFGNVTIAGGPAPVRAYIEELLPDVLEGRIEPGRVFDRVTDLDGVPDGYRAMNDREAIKVMNGWRRSATNSTWPGNSEATSGGVTTCVSASLGRG